MNKKLQIGLGITFLLICSAIVIMIWIIPQKVKNFDYYKKNVISNEHFNGSYIDGDIIARKNYDYITGEKKIKILKNGEWTDFLKIKIKNNYRVEDPRVFEINDKIYKNILTWVERKNLNKIYHYASLYTGDDIVKKIKLIDPKYPNNDQKNWILINSDDLQDTHWIMWFGPKIITLRINMFTGSIKNGWETDGVEGLRGGTPFFSYSNKLYGICHTTSYFPRKICNVYVEIENKPPYKISRISEKFTFNKNPRFEFVTGIKFKNGYVYILLGENDNMLIEYIVLFENFIKKLKLVDKNTIL